MRSAVAARTRIFCAPVAWLTWVFCLAAAGGRAPASTEHPELLTNLFQLRQAAEQEIQVVHPFRIVATVMDVDSASRVLALRDASGTEFIRVNFSDRDIEPGATVSLEGSGCGFRLRGFGLAIVPGMVVENDDIHPFLVETGRTFLHAGTNPIALKWFNRFGDLGLTVEYEGPNVPRQQIPDSALSLARVDAATGRTNLSPGLKFRSYEGDWEVLPDFRKYRPTKTGIATNFDLGVRTRGDMVGLEFNGLITIPRDGVYTFYLGSDDGSRLFVGEPSVAIRALSERAAPGAEEPAPLEILEHSNRRWVTLEGIIESVGVWDTGGEFRMRVENSVIRVEVFQSGDSGPDLPPLHSKVRVSGIYEKILTDEGSPIPGRLLVLDWKAVRTAAAEPHSAGTVEDMAVPGVAGSSPAGGLPALRTVKEIKELSPELAKQGLPVSIRGVVTASGSRHWGAVVQDATAGVFVNMFRLPGRDLLRRGDLCLIEGVTDPGLFAPVINARRITRLGAGQLPKPLRATFDQLVNGSLDTEYAEIDGFVTAIQGRSLAVLTAGGKITLDLKEFRPEALSAYENAVIRIRGCFLAGFNMTTRKLEPGSLVVSGAEVDVLQPAPRDFFDAPQRSIEELLLYDPKAAPLRLLKVSGQVIHSGPGECYLTDGTNGVHVTTRSRDQIAVGELMDAVGFLKFGGPAAELREAVLRKTGRAPLPAPTRLTEDQLLLARNSGTLVLVGATLISHWREGAEQVLELQSGFLVFRARIRDPGHAVSLPPSGSRLELTGAYAPLGNRAADGTVNAFQLLLHAPASVRVLATPPWWTLKRVLILAGLLAALLCGALVWNKELQSRVEARGRQLETEIRNRQQAELHRAAEAERSRIARDLHDELGTSLTEVSLLASAGLGQFHDGEKIRKRFHAIGEKARGLVSGLDAIIWAIDPKRNSLQSFADYVDGYANELFSSSGIVCRLRVRIECGAVALSESQRHSLFLAVKEALNNVIRHASATEVELRLSHLGDCLQIFISDNGRGFDWETVHRGNGLTNLQERLRAMRGERHVESQPGKGTTVKLVVPLGRAADSLPCDEAPQYRNSTV